MPRTGVSWPVRIVATMLFAVALLGLLAALFPDQTIETVLGTWYWQARYRVSPVEGAPALGMLHLDAGALHREQCIACHGDMRESKMPLHRIHLQSELLPGLACQQCHPRVDLAPRGNTAVVKWVDVGFCKKCHSPFPGLSANSKMTPADYDKDCTSCHKDDKAPRHDAPYLARNIPSSACKGCHGGRVLPWTPAHEKSDWLQVHGREALDSGTQACFECHDFGFRFCDACHAKKPPSHLPADRWKDVHPEAARKDTRACYTCHETGFCKNCHVNHEAGWLASHPAYIAKHGDASCTECHSVSACSFCHTKAAAEETSTPAVETP